MADMPPVKIALILDGEVVDVLHVDDRMAAILLSDPIIRDVTGTDGLPTTAVGDLYDSVTSQFIKQMT